MCIGTLTFGGLANIVAGVGTLEVVPHLGVAAGVVLDAVLPIVLPVRLARSPVLVVHR